nr:lysozyme C, milk isozyme-like [Marmota flaviventris]
MDHRHYRSLPDICLAGYESNFNTQAFNEKNADGSSDYGIFQLNNLWWEDKHFSENACNTLCSKFVDEDIDDDILCAKKVVKDPKGMSFDKEIVKHCKSKDLSKYLASSKL